MIKWVKNDQPLHHKNVMAVVHPLSKIINILLTLCSEWPSESHLAPRNGVLCDRVLLMLQHHSHIGQKWLFHFAIYLQSYEKLLLALSRVIRSVCLHRTTRPHGTDCHEILYWSIICQKNSSFIKIWQE